MQGPGPTFQMISILRSSDGGGVFCARDSSEQVVAVKRAQVKGNPRRFAELENELEVARRCDSPLLRKCHRLIQEKRLLRLEAAALVMEYIEGQTLEQSHPEDPLELCQIFLQVAAGLAVLHEKNIVHCDLRPANIMINKQGSVKLIGLSQACPVGSVKTSIQGAPAFIAPEQLRGERLGPTADIYSLGVTLFYLITGRLPQGKAKVSQEGLRYGRDKHGVAPQDLNKGVPAALVNFITQCIKPNPGDRIKSMRAIQEVLRLAEKQLAAEVASRSKAPRNQARYLDNLTADTEAADAATVAADSAGQSPLGTIKVLLIDAIEADIALMQATLGEQNLYGFEVAAVGAAAQAIELLAQQPFDVAVVELNLPDCSGLELIGKLQQEHRSLAVVVASEKSDREQRLSGELFQAGVQDYLEKEYLDSGALPRILVRAVQRHRAHLTAVARQAQKQLKLASKLEQVVQQTEQRLRAAVEDNPEAIVILAADRTTLLANPAAHKLWAAEPEALLGKPLALDFSFGDSPAELHDQRGRSVPVQVSIAKTQWDGQPAQVLSIRKLTSVAAD